MLNWFKKDPKEEMKRLLDESDSKLAQFEKVLNGVKSFCDENNIANELHCADDYLKKMVELNKQRRELDKQLDELVKKSINIDQLYGEQTKLFQEELIKIQKHLEG